MTCPGVKGHGWRQNRNLEAVWRFQQESGAGFIHLPKAGCLRTSGAEPTASEKGPCPVRASGAVLLTLSTVRWWHLPCPGPLSWTRAQVF